MAQSKIDLSPKLNQNDHGPMVVLAGGITLSATLFMTAIALYNRFNAETLRQVDTILLSIGVALNTAFFIVQAVAVNDGFGHHIDAFDDSVLRHLRKLTLRGLVMFYLCAGVMEVSYNFLLRRTARDERYARYMDVFSGLICAWAVGNIAVVAFHATKTTPPERSFLVVTGAINIAIVLGQCASFLWIIWRTRAALKSKIRWSIAVACFVPLAVSAIVIRLCHLPVDLFSGDWTFNNVIVSMLFLIESNLITMTVLSPNLPIFFQYTSTGGVFFLPHEATGYTRNGNSGNGNSVALSNIYTGKGGQNITSISNTAEHDMRGDGKHKRASFDSDVILMRHSVDVESRSQAGNSSFNL